MKQLFVKATGRRKKNLHQRPDRNIKANCLTGSGIPWNTSVLYTANTGFLKLGAVHKSTLIPFRCQQTVQQPPPEILTGQVKHIIAAPWYSTDLIPNLQNKADTDMTTQYSSQTI